VANSKQKPVPEGAKRSPGKSKFSIPRKEAPPIDGSYLDRLFADYDRQSKELGGQTAGDHPEAEVPERQQVTEITRPASASAAAPPPPAEVSQIRPPEVTVPFPPEEVVPAEPAEAPAPAHSEASADSAAGDEQTSGVIEQEQPAFVRPPSSSDDEALLDRWKKRHRLSKGEVKVMRVMARMCREAGGDHCYIKIPQLMTDAELKERQTQLVLRSLRALGLVEKLADYSNADRMGTKYRVIFESE
jgi:hypothetical protein